MARTCPLPVSWTWPRSCVNQAVAADRRRRRAPIVVTPSCTKKLSGMEGSCHTSISSDTKPALSSWRPWSSRKFSMSSSTEARWLLPKRSKKRKITILVLKIIFNDMLLKVAINCMKRTSWMYLKDKCSLRGQWVEFGAALQKKTFKCIHCRFECTQAPSRQNCLKFHVNINKSFCIHIFHLLEDIAWRSFPWVDMSVSEIIYTLLSWSSFERRLFIKTHPQYWQDKHLWHKKASLTKK